jgi:hypothetical protein
MHAFTSFVVALTLSAGALTARAQQEPADPVNRFVWQMFQMHDGKTLCAQDTTLPAVRARLIEHLHPAPGEALTPQALGMALWQLYPCPFAPQRAELRPAVAAEITGAWVFPEGSQKLRRGPRANVPSPTGPLPVKCDAVGYFPEGELRHAIVAGVPRCPFEAAADLETARRQPRVASWALLRDGRVGVTRTDVASHVEEWDVYVVQRAFEFRDIAFREGDLVAYARRENGNDVGAAMQFRHLQRLP